MTDFSYTKPPEVGDYIGKYLLIKEIGRGGMALIFEAQHEDQTDRCAVKVMLNPQKVEETEEVAVRVVSTGLTAPPPERVEESWDEIDDETVVSKVIDNLDEYLKVCLSHRSGCI